MYVRSCRPVIAAGSILAAGAGTGTTIVDVHPGGGPAVFADLSGARTGCPAGVGLTTAMVQLRTGWVIVGSLPSTDGKTDIAGQGCLLVLSPKGTLAETLTGAYLNGPWDATVKDSGATASLFVSNTLVDLTHSTTAKAAQGNVVRLSLRQTPVAINQADNGVLFVKDDENTLALLHS